MNDSENKAPIAEANAMGGEVAERIQNIITSMRHDAYQPEVDSTVSVNKQLLHELLDAAQSMLTLPQANASPSGDVELVNAASEALDALKHCSLSFSTIFEQVEKVGMRPSDPELIANLGETISALITALKPFTQPTQATTKEEK